MNTVHPMKIVVGNGGLGASNSQKNSDFYAGSWGSKLVRREGIEPATLVLKALVSLSQNGAHEFHVS